MSIEQQQKELYPDLISENRLYVFTHCVYMSPYRLTNTFNQIRLDESLKHTAYL